MLQKWCFCTKSKGFTLGPPYCRPLRSFLYSLSVWKLKVKAYLTNYNDAMMSVMASKITGVSVVCSTVCSGANRRKHQSSASLPCEGNPPMAGGFPSQRASNAENVPIWWRHHATSRAVTYIRSALILRRILMCEYTQNHGLYAK